MKGGIGILRDFKSYVGHRHSCGDPIGEDWESVTPEEFDQYKIGPDFMALVTESAPQPSQK